jgi:hypothetical protein
MGAGRYQHGRDGNARERRQCTPKDSQSPAKDSEARLKDVDVPHKDTDLAFKDIDVPLKDTGLVFKDIAPANSGLGPIAPCETPGTACPRAFRVAVVMGALRGRRHMAKAKAATEKAGAKKAKVDEKTTLVEQEETLRAIVVSTGTQEGETVLEVPPPTTAERARYDAEAAAVAAESLGLSLPFGVFTGEALDAARFVWNRWASKRDATTNKVVTPGLELALTRDEREGKKPARLSRTLAHEIAHLVGLAQQANNQSILAAGASGDGALDERAGFLTSEIEGVLDWHFSSDGVLDERDAQLAQVREAHANDGAARDVVAQKLQDYAALAQTYRAELDDLGGFDAALIDEAFKVADTLRATPKQPVENTRRMSAVEQRNRYVAVAMVRVAKVRAAAQLVFREQPKVIREVTSTYLRRRRAEARRAKVARETEAKKQPK